MKTGHNAVGWGYFLLWLLGVLIAVVAGMAVFFGVMSALGSGGAIPVPAASLIMTGCFGTVIGLAQWFILRRYVQRSALWIGFTLLAFLICSPILLSLSGGFGPAINPSSSFNMTLALGSVLGVAQWLSIRRKVSWSTVWVGISLVCWVMAGWIGFALKTLSVQMGPILYWLGMFYAGALLSALGMMAFFKMKPDAGGSEIMPAEQPSWRRLMNLPGTRLGWWSLALVAVYLVSFLVLFNLAGKVSWGRTAAILIGMLVSLCTWAAGIAGLVAVVEQRERSILVWTAMFPAAYSLVQTLNSALREFLAPYIHA